MKHLTKITWLAVVVTLLTLAACGGGASPSATPDTGSVFTQIAMTALAFQTQTALAVPAATNTPLASPTLEFTNTPLLTDTPGPGTPSVTPLTLATQSLATPTHGLQSSCDNVQSVNDVNYPDNKEVPAGSSFTKTWSFTNLGPCTWNSNYHLIFSYQSAGAGWDGTGPVNFSGDVLPGDTLNISVVLAAPSTAGTYRGTFRLQNDKGFNFGPEFWVQIVVK